MNGFFEDFLASDFMPHGHCYAWRAEILWLHAVSDTLIALSYYSIPLTLLYFVRKRRDLPFNWLFLMFGAFIFACGTTHVLEVWTVWHGTYRLTGVVKLLTAVISVATAVALIPIIPRALALPSPEALRHEVNERRRAEQDLLLARDSLDKEVRVRTAELVDSNLKLANAYMDLKRANRDLEEFVRIASHDLQEPLRKIGVFGDRIRGRFGERLGEQGLDYLDRMQRASVRMSRLLQDLLALSRMGSRAIRPQPVNLTEIVRSVELDLEVRIEESGARIEVDPLPVVSADPTQMRVLFQNLIGNGIKFRAAGTPPVVRIRSRMFMVEESTPPESAGGEGRRSGRWVEIEIADNGIGFEPEHAETIFKPFQRLHTREVYEGSGVGLAICRKIVQNHRGEITAESAPGQGATFRFTLPVDPGEAMGTPDSADGRNEESTNG